MFLLALRQHEKDPRKRRELVKKCICVLAYNLKLIFNLNNIYALSFPMPKD